MLRFLSTALLLLPLFFTPFFAYGQSADPNQTHSAASASANQSSTKAPANAAPKADEPIPANAPHISRETRLQIIRDFETQLVYARTAFPMGTKGLQLKQGVITPNGEDLRQALAIFGPALKPGDPARISFMQIKNNRIHFELNGGPIRREKWYQHIQVSGAGGSVQPPLNDPQTNAHGSFVDLYFGRYVPEMTAQQLRTLLLPVFDFNARNREQAYLDTVPPKVKEAIQAHHVLVGMNEDMVVYAKGRPPKKVREHDGGTEYEEWIYGAPPADVDFVRFVAGEVVRVETMKVGGEKIVRTEREVTLPQPDKDKEAKKEQEDRPASAPSLRRPGEDSQDAPRPASSPLPLPPAPPPDQPQPGSGPGQNVVASR